MIPQNYVRLARAFGAWSIWGCVPGNPTIDLSGNNRPLTITGTASPAAPSAGIPQLRWSASGVGLNRTLMGGTTVSMMCWLRRVGTTTKGAWIGNGTTTFSTWLGIGNGDLDTLGTSLIGLNVNNAFHDTGVTVPTGDVCAGVTVNAAAMRFFLNGKMVATASRGSGAQLGAGAGMGAQVDGGGGGTANRFWAQPVSGGLLFSTVLTDGQMAQLYVAGLRDRNLLLPAA